jgi:hypothetical protein
MTRALNAAAIAALLVFTLGCDEKLSDIAGPTPNLEPTFSSIQSNILTAGDSSGRQACTNCHNAVLANVNGGLNLTGAGAYAALVNARSRDKSGATRVIPGDPNGSYVVQKLEGASGIVGVRMPQVPPYLTPGQMSIIRRWIQLGAPND